MTSVSNLDVSHNKVVVARQDAIDPFCDHAAVNRLDLAVQVDEIDAGVLLGVLLAFEPVKGETVRESHPFVGVFPSCHVQRLGRAVRDA